MSDEIIRFVEPVFRFCLKRLSSYTDAQDLSQEILFCVLQGIKNANIDNMDGYVWRIAHNRYAKMIDARNREVMIVCGDEYLIDIPYEAEEDNNEEYQGVFKALHTLSSMYREILVDFYVRNLDVSAISKLRGVSIETVKWRLHVGRERIRERMYYMEKNYEKIKMHIMCNGSFEPNRYLDTQLHKAIAKACYDTPLSIEEISLVTGVPTLYLEEALERMIWGDAVEKNGQKYATDFIITSNEQIIKMRKFLNESVVKEVTNTIIGYINATEKTIRNIGFYGSDFPTSSLLHITVPAILYSATERIRESAVFLPKQRPLRKDGGNGWFIINEGIESIDENFSGCNGYHYDSKGGQSGRFIYYWVGSNFDDKLNKILNSARFFINSIGPGDACFFTDDTDAAMGFANGLCVNRNGRTYPTIPIFTEKQYAVFTEWAKNCNVIDHIWQKWIDTLFKAYQSFVPKRLANQIGGNVESYSYNLSAFILKELQNRGLADIPEEGKVFTKNIVLIRG